MKYEVCNELTYGNKLVYYENFWTGKKSLEVGGRKFIKTAKNVFSDENNSSIFITIHGNVLFGVTATINGRKVEIVKKPSIYEYILTALVFIPCLFYGAVGGFIGAIFAFTNLILIRNIKAVWLKIVISIEIAVISFFLCRFVAQFIAKAIISLFS